MSLIEKVAKLPSKKLQYVLHILLLSGTPVSVDDLVAILSFNHRTFFNENYLKPLCSLGFIQRTNPNKPTSPNQKYLITEQGKRFLTGKNDYLGLRHIALGRGRAGSASSALYSE